MTATEQAHFRELVERVEKLEASVFPPKPAIPPPERAAARPILSLPKAKSA